MINEHICSQRKFCVRFGRTNVWWENFFKIVVVSDECRERMLFGTVHAGIRGQKRFWKEPFQDIV